MTNPSIPPPAKQSSVCQPRLQMVLMEESQIGSQHVQLRVLPIGIILYAMLEAAVIVVAQLAATGLVEVFGHALLLLLLSVGSFPSSISSSAFYSLRLPWLGGFVGGVPFLDVCFRCGCGSRYGFDEEEEEGEENEEIGQYEFHCFTAAGHWKAGTLSSKTFE